MIAETDAALEELEPLDDPRALGALSARGQSEYSLGRAAAAYASADRALEVLRAVDEDTVWALENLARACTSHPCPYRRPSNSWSNW